MSMYGMLDQSMFGGQSEFVAGSIYGRRRFKVSKGGGLLPVRIGGYAYGPAENIANHNVYDGGHIRRNSRGFHQVAGRYCCCGFYAYFHKTTDHYAFEENTFEAIIEGYGLTTVGSLGFRCEKLRIKAFVNPYSFRAVLDRAWRHPLPRWSAVVSVVAFVVLVVGALVIPGWWWWIFFAVPFGSAIIALCGLLATTSDISKEQWSKVRKRYPDVPVLPSMKAAYRKFPLYAPEGGSDE